MSVTLEVHARRNITLLLLIGSAVAAAAQQPLAPVTRPLSTDDIRDWKSIRFANLSNNGRWFAYQLAPNEGDAEVILRSTVESKELRFQIGEPPAAVGGAPGAAVVQSAPVAIAANSRFVAFYMYAPAKDARKLKRDRKPSYNRLGVVNVATGEKREFDKVRRFAFAGEEAEWLAMQDGR